MTDHPRSGTPTRTPWLEALLGYGPASILPLAALGWFVTRQPWLIDAGRVWGAAILIFLAGVTRGLSFFTEGGPRVSQIVIMLLRFLLGLAALLAPPPPAFVLLIIGYASIALTDTAAARDGAAPRYFARLRPPQMLVAEAGLIALLIATLGLRASGG